MITTINEFKKINETIDNTQLATEVMLIATPEQKIVLDDFQSGTEFFFFNLLKIMGPITVQSIDKVLMLMVNQVEGDTSQLEEEHIKYAELKGWLKDFSLDESLENPTKQVINEEAGDYSTEEHAIASAISKNLESLVKTETSGQLLNKSDERDIANGIVKFEIADVNNPGKFDEGQIVVEIFYKK